MTAGTLAPASGAVRRDIEVLRAVAIVLVLLFHAGLAAVPGGFIGVDVFFVISGFLITGLLVREAEKSGRISLRDFWARRVRRLLPAAATVLVFTSLLIFFVAPGSLRRAFGLDVAAAAGYVANWRFGLRSVDYLNSDLPPSPVQHFWSLSVEEQFYFVWPLLLVLVVLGVRKYGWPLRTTAAIALTAVAVPSLWWSITSTADSPEFAFFDTRARMWELALGGLVAVGAPLMKRLNTRVTGAMVVVGGVAIVLSALRVTGAADWPGTLAIVPVIGTAMIIAAGTSTDSMRAASRAWSPMVWIGGLSYSVYLWHWPLLVAAHQTWGRLDPWAGLAIVTASFIPAWLTHKYIENPVRFSPRLRTRPTRSLLIGAGLTLIAAGTGATVAAQATTLEARPVGTLGINPYGVAPLPLTDPDPTAPLGAAWLWPNPTAKWPSIPEPQAALLTPDPGDVVSDGPKNSAFNCRAVIDVSDVEPEWCLAGDRDAPRRIVLVGDSKANQWFNVIHGYGVERGWQVDVTAKASCGFSDATYFTGKDKPYARCVEWNDAVMAQLAADPPDVVVTSGLMSTAAPRGSTLSTDANSAGAVDGFASRWQTLTDMGITVIVIADNPLPDPKFPECLNDHLDDLHACEFSRGVAIASSGAEELMRAAERVDGVTAIDMTDYFCDDKTCPVVIGNVIVYRGGYHASDSFLRTLAPYVAWELDSALPQ